MHILADVTRKDLYNLIVSQTDSKSTLNRIEFLRNCRTRLASPDHRLKLGRALAKPLQ